MAPLKSVVLYLALASALAARESDIDRAQTKVPGDAFRGAGFAAMTATLNRALSKQAATPEGVPIAPCEDFSAAEIAEVQAGKRALGAKLAARGRAALA